MRGLLKLTWLEIRIFDDPQGRTWISVRTGGLWSNPIYAAEAVRSIPL